MPKNDSIYIESNLRQFGGDESFTTLSETRSNQQSAFEQAAAAIVCGKGEGAGETTSFGIEMADIEGWSKQTPMLILAEQYR